MVWLRKFAIIMAFLSSTAVSDQYVFCQPDCKLQCERIQKLTNAKIRQLSLLLLYVLCPCWEKIGDHIGLALSNIPNRNNALAVFSLYPLYYILLLWHHWIFFLPHPAFYLVIWFDEHFCHVAFGGFFAFWSQGHCLTEVIFLCFAVPWIEMAWAHVTSDFFLNDFWFLLPSHSILSRNVENYKDAISKFSFTLLLFHQAVHLFDTLFYSSRFALIKCRKPSP